MKRLICFILLIIVVLGLGVFAFADDSPVPSGPSYVVPTVAPKAEDIIPEYLADTAPIQAETVEEAIDLLSPTTPVVVITEQVSLTDSSGTKIKGIGFNVVDEKTNSQEVEVKTAPVIAAVPDEAIQMIPVCATEEDPDTRMYKKLVYDVNNVIPREETEHDGAIISAFYFRVDETIGGDVADSINIDEYVNGMNYAIKMTFACEANDGVPRVYLNRVPLPVVDNKNGTFTVVLSEESSVIISVDPAED